MKNNSLILNALIGLIAVFLAYGCSGPKVSKQTQKIANLNKPIVLEKTGENDRPDWTNNPSFFEDDTGFHFTGGIMGGADYSLTLRLAKAEAMKNLLESIEIKARSEFSYALQGGNRNDSDIGRYVTDAVAWTIDNLRISGIRQRQVYYEQVFNPASQAVKYNTWIELEIPISDYTKAKVNAAERLLNKTLKEQDQEARKKAQELLDKLRTEV
ncbi:hypothetical protein H8E88_22965 [candidate division KSB1 bacterium]|nr:hypothetical protein [candidate division KSB1 bacterium]